MYSARKPSLRIVCRAMSIGPANAPGAAVCARVLIVSCERWDERNRQEVDGTAAHKRLPDEDLRRAADAAR